MYMCVHFFTVCCFPAAGVGPLAAARDPAAESDRTCPCHSACPRLLLPTATTAPVQSPGLAHTGTRSSSGPLWSHRGGDGCCGWRLCPACCWFTVTMLGTQQGPRVPALATPSQAGDAPHLQAGERRKPSLSSGTCSCFPSGLQSRARAPPALALPPAKCCAIAGLCPRRWGLTGYVFSNPPSGFSPIPARPVLPGAHARTLAF